MASTASATIIYQRYSPVFPAATARTGFFKAEIVDSPHHSKAPSSFGSRHHVIQIVMEAVNEGSASSKTHPTV
jgi:hypothetical protein